MLQDAKHIERIILVPVVQRVRAVVRIKLVLADGDTRKAAAALRTQPLVADSLVAMRLDQRCQVMATVELRNDFGQ
ncbi:hypothetical protein D3C77_178240 [compost metagenome]